MDLGVAPWTQEIRTRIVNFLQGDFASSLPALYASWQARSWGQPVTPAGYLILIFESSSICRLAKVRV